MAQFAYLM